MYVCIRNHVPNKSSQGAKNRGNVQAFLTTPNSRLLTIFCAARGATEVWRLYEIVEAGLSMKKYQ
jgi:hypothetical protein